MADVTAAEGAPESGTRPFLFIQAGNMSEYRCKSPFLMPTHPYLGANEWITGHLARALGIPVRPVEIIEWQGELYVGSEVLPNDRKMTGPLTPAAWARLRNAPAVAYGVVVLDVWALNGDRHDHNWLGGVLSSEHGLFLANDHDMALLPPPREPVDLGALTNAPIDDSLLRSSILREAITDAGRLADAIASAQMVTDALLGTIVGQVPSAWLSHTQKELVLVFLSARRQRLSDLFTAGRVRFPNLPMEAA